MKQASTGPVWFPVLVALLWVGTFWAGIRVFAEFIEPWIVFRCEVPLSGALSNPVVTGTNPYQGLWRSIAFLASLFVVGAVATSRPFRPAWNLILESPAASFIIVLAAFGLLFAGRYEQEDIAYVATGAICSVVLGVGLVLLEDSSKLRGSARILPFVAFCGLGLCVPLESFRAWVAPGTWLELVDVEFVWIAGPLAALVVALFTQAVFQRLLSVDETEVAWLLLPVALACALAGFAKWPPGFAIVGITVTSALIAPFLVMSFRSRAFAMLPRHANLFLIPVALTIVALTAAPITRLLDPHHEAEAIIPAYLVGLGRLPFRDFIMSHSLVTDVLPGWLAFKMWEPSICAERMFRCFVAGPVRAVTVWLTLAEIFSAPMALLMCVCLALTGFLNTPFTNEAFRLEPVLVCLILYLRYYRLAWNGYLYLSCVAAAAGLFVAPELGIPFALGFLVTLLYGVLFTDNRSVYSRSLLVFLTCIALIVGLLYWQDMWTGFVRYLTTLRAISTELVSRWPSLSVSNPFLRIHLLLLVFAAIAMVRSSRRNEKILLCAPVLVVAVSMAFAMVVDGPERLSRLLVIDVLLVALVVMADFRRFSVAAVTTVLLFVSLVSPLRPWAASGFLLPLRAMGGTENSAPFGPCPFAPGELQFWREFQTWSRGAGEYFNASNSLLDQFMINGKRSTFFLPTHMAFRPCDQQLLCKDLTEILPRHVLFRSMQDPVFMQITPYTLIFNVLDARILEHYKFDRRIGPLHILALSQDREARTYNNLLDPNVVRTLDYGSAPLCMGDNARTGISRVYAAVRTALPAHRLRHWSASIVGSGTARFRILAQSNIGSESGTTSRKGKVPETSGASDPSDKGEGISIAGHTAAPVEITFQLKADGKPHTYAIPLWNLCNWGDSDPARVFKFEVMGDGIKQVQSAGLRGPSDMAGNPAKQ